jgi:cellulose synthase/poly-beta-1,6-N-acetylglucosamine synthase-like glycosyltransferase
MTLHPSELHRRLRDQIDVSPPPAHAAGAPIPPSALHQRLESQLKRLSPRRSQAVQTAAAFLRRVGPGRSPGIARLPAELSAARTTTRPQALGLLALGLTVLVTVALQPLAGLTALVGVATLLYLAAFVYRVSAFWHALRSPDLIQVPDEVARAIPDAELPVYSVLVAAYKEPEVMGQLIEALDRLEYPRHKLDVKLLLEEDDQETFRALGPGRMRTWIEVLRLPYSAPRTKPKACNVGLARARGSLVTIYDAEDKPDPLQLRRAAAAFRSLDPAIACLQARLAYHNSDQNLITRWFTTEYAMWFSQLLPGLVQREAPLPLGGTSNHFRREVLDAIGAWDAWNVTEDADLGIRLHRAGYRTRILDSITFEEANSDFVNWIKQRSRWYKGYLQTWLVHLRRPRELYRQLGLRGFIGFNLFVGGTPLLALINPVFWALTALWFIGRPAFVAALFPAWIYYLSLFCLVGGNLTFLYTWIVSARAAGSASLTLAALLSPLYWAMMSVAAIKATVQLVSAPSFWEKTVHGLDHRAHTEEARRAAA